MEDARFLCILKHASFSGKFDDLTILMINKDTMILMVFNWADCLIVFPMESSKPVTQDFDYLLVLDFEATCIEHGKIQPVQEIIEFPVIAIKTDGWKETAIFHQYVKPTVNSTLTTFCTSLTGIIQETVDNGKTLPEVLEDFDVWLGENQIKQTNFTFVTCGDWDLKFALPDECQAKKIEIPEYFKKWINLKKAYAKYTGRYPKGDLKEMLAGCNLTLEGRHHSGIDDTKNICRIVETLYKGGYKFRNSNQVARTVWNSELDSTRSRERPKTRSTLRPVVKDAQTPTGERTYWGADGKRRPLQKPTLNSFLEKPF
ncbi:hypothetical protein WR25_10048 [Diploscapter pachys]|uniref:Exonuclease domain-containing protein n=1 Tax=Diploscapter pachys TaxID=2018661 RepID=A0A2A2JA85_9BILA|nr:hypothetical protein WR25_10048 [Diploscapter pachys]